MHFNPYAYSTQRDQINILRKTKVSKHITYLHLYRNKGENKNTRQRNHSIRDHLFSHLRVLNYCWCRSWPKPTKSYIWCTCKLMRRFRHAQRATKSRLTGANKKLKFRNNQFHSPNDAFWRLCDRCASAIVFRSLTRCEITRQPITVLAIVHLP